MRPALRILAAFVAGGALMWGFLRFGLPMLAHEPAPHEAPRVYAEAKSRMRELGEFLSLPRALPALPTLLSRDASRIIYLSRERLTLAPGTDDAARNRSSIVRRAKLPGVIIPGFSGSKRTWRRIVRCVQRKFDAFDVVVTDRRPLDSDSYVMAVFGGSARILGRSARAAKHTGGLAPFSGRSIPASVVFVFSGTLRNDVTAICETASMEIAHTYGLDHSYHCKDIMTYRQRCGARTFIDKAVRCGEKKPRDCVAGQATQNGYQRLLSLLGPRSRHAGHRGKSAK